MKFLPSLSWPSTSRTSRNSLTSWPSWFFLVGLTCLNSLVLQGCSMEPPYQRPQVKTEATFSESFWTPAHPQLAEVPDTWWDAFHDPVLSSLEKQVSVSNETILNNLAQLRMAKGSLESSVASLYPTFGGTASGVRSRNAQTTNANGVSQVNTNLANTFTLSGNFSWDLDLWGRLASTVHENEAFLQASAETLAAVRLAQQISLAQTYFAMRTAEATAATWRKTVESNKAFLALTEKRRQSGVAASADVAAAEGQLQSSQAQLIEQELLRAQAAHAVAVLLGKQPGELRLEVTGVLPEVPPLPALIPSTLLQRRPDIAAAERNVAAANAAVGVAKAALFPDITLNGSGGFRAGLLPKLLKTSQEFWSIGPALSFSGFNAPLLNAVNEQTAGNVEKALSAYRQTVLTAFQEVEDNLAAAQQLQKEQAAQGLALKAAQTSLQVALAQYKAGTVSYLNVITAQNAALVAENAWTAVRNRQLVATGILLKNAAGPWDDKNLPAVNASTLVGATTK